MAKAMMDDPNSRIELTHDEAVGFTDKVLAGGEVIIEAALKAFGVPISAVGVVAAALAQHAAWKVPAVKAADKGRGVFLRTADQRSTKSRTTSDHPR